MQATYTIGANSYLVKPVRFGPFVQCVSAACRYWLAYNQPPPYPRTREVQPQPNS